MDMKKMSTESLEELKTQADEELKRRSTAFRDLKVGTKIRFTGVTKTFEAMVIEDQCVERDASYDGKALLLYNPDHPTPYISCLYFQKLLDGEISFEVIGEV